MKHLFDSRLLSLVLAFGLGAIPVSTQAANCAHIECRYGYSNSGCACTFPMTCSDPTWSYNPYSTCVNQGGRYKTCLNVQFPVGNKTECDKVLNYGAILGCLGSLSQIPDICEDCYVQRNLFKCLGCVGSIISATAACVGCGSMVTCTVGKTTPAYVAIFNFCEVGSECSGGIAPCDPI